jgi:hypothetical protein
MAVKIILSLPFNRQLPVLCPDYHIWPATDTNTLWRQKIFLFQKAFWECSSSLVTSWCMQLRFEFPWTYVDHLLLISLLWNTKKYYGQPASNRVAGSNNVKIVLFSVMVISFTGDYQRFGGNCCLHPLGTGMVEVTYSETLVTAYEITCCQKTKILTF